MTTPLIPAEGSVPVEIVLEVVVGNSALST